MGRETMSLRTPTPLGYGNSTRFLTLEAIETALNKRLSKEYERRHKKKQKSLERKDRQTFMNIISHLKALYYTRQNSKVLYKGPQQLE